MKQYPILRMVVATKNVEYIHQFELAQLMFNQNLREEHAYLMKRLKELEDHENETNDYVGMKKRLDENSINGKPVQLDFIQFVSTDRIIRNTFEIGLVSDERRKGDVVGRKGILAADLKRQEIEEEEDIIE